MENDNNISVSIIIPVYNVERYLRKCLDSVVNQTLRDIEIILVNDASPDNSLSICKEYQSKDNHIKIIDKKQNEGVDKARFSGINIARGKYVTFVDSDDWLANNQVLAEMYAKAEEYNADYVEIGMSRVLGNRIKIKRKKAIPVVGLIEQPELFEKYYVSFFGHNILPVNIWGKLYRRSVIENAKMLPSGITMGEDLVFNMKLFPHLKRIYIMSSHGYCYRYGGMTNRYNPKLLPDLKFLYRLKQDLIKKYNYDKAFNLTRYELKNVLCSDIKQRILYNLGGVMS